ncbi:hypothetical protein ACYSNO_09915 [Enterococcus sp. LJL98]
MEKKPNTLKKIGQRIVMTSVTLLDHLFNDHLVAEQLLEESRIKLMEAALNHSMVVLQLQTEKIDRFETVVGFVASKKMDKGHVVIKMQNNPNQLRIIPLNQIEKVSVLGRKKPLAK